MTPESQRIAIAEACGWKRIEQYPEARTDGSDNWIEDYMGSKNGVRTCIPDYLHDLNACHEMEKVLTPGQWSTYHGHLADVTGFSYDDTMSTKEAETEWTHRVCSATPAQRCEAFLRTLGLWREPSS